MTLSKSGVRPSYMVAWASFGIGAGGWPGCSCPDGMMFSAVSA